MFKTYSNFTSPLKSNKRILVTSTTKIKTTQSRVNNIKLYEFINTLSQSKTAYTSELDINKANKFALTVKPTVNRSINEKRDTKK